MKPLSRVLALTVAVALNSTTAIAYETDFHYGLTYWLAERSGFTAAQSHNIARGNELSDRGMRDAKHAIIWGVCFQGDQGAGEITREHHFRSQTPLPAPRAKRPVDSKAAFATTDVKALINESGTLERDYLPRFGRALHGWQDTFSHRGEPSSVAGCPDEIVWAHPQKYGGPLSHSADLTFQRPEDCLEAARTSYDWMLRFRARRRMDPSTAPSWNQLSEAVKRFCSASYKSQKVEWLRQNNVPRAESIVKGINLQDGPNAPSKGYSKAADLDLSETALQKDPPFSNPAPFDPLTDRQVNDVINRVYGKTQRAGPGAETAIERMCEIWLTTPLDDLPRGLAPFGIDGQTADKLARLRIADRGLAEKAMKLPDLAEQGGVVSASPGDWRSLLVRPRRQERAVYVGVDPRTNLLVAIVVLRHSPYDVVVIRATPSGDSFRVTSVETIVYH